MRAHDLGPDAYYYGRLYFGEAGADSEVLFIGRAEAERTVVHKTGFIRVGTNGLVVPNEVGEVVGLELGLRGPGKVEFHDFKFLNVSALSGAYEGRKVLTEADFEALPERERRGQVARPETLFTLRGLYFLLTAYLPIDDWVTPFWPGRASPCSSLRPVSQLWS